ncbi:hypothetical protein K2F54_17600 [Cryobacterium sp. 1639]|uniref:hypothetical protein n=1 Tax=Cryobacterium inferilacus TaxID=2866629 RepID=UPI001C73CAB9|nr:hypothetical protein [Cryobacterium sp. 1639]MBX0301782.1 hypothetical protein [Cryobacterium sp. 1639]
MRRGVHDDEWVALGFTPWWLPVIGMGPGWFLLFYAPLLVGQVATIFDVPLGWALVLTLACAAGCLALGLGFVRWRYPPAYVHPATLTIRAGRKRARYAEVTGAKILVSTSKKRRSVTLVLLSEQKLRGAVVLRDARQNVIDPAEAALLQDLVRQSNIALPVSPDDPKGRFTRYNFPGYLTKEDALEIVAHPPAPADPLPTGPTL